jgi:hypothetical protein
MKSSRNGIINVIIVMVTLLDCSGGGADVGNPLTGVVTMQSSSGQRVAGAQVVMARRNADPGIPGVFERPTCTPDVENGIGFCTDPVYFDTTFTDETGAFAFDGIASGEYALLVRYNDLYGLEYVRYDPSQPYGWDQPAPGQIAIAVSKPATVKLLLYEPVDTSEELHFKGARIVGTEMYGISDANGEVTFDKAPEGVVDIAVYRSDSVRMQFPALRTYTGETAVLYALPSVDVNLWTAHHSGPRHELDRPYVLETYFPAQGDNGASSLDSGKSFTIRIKFSHNMDVLRTSDALRLYGDDPSAAVQSLKWEGADALYILLCVPDSSGTCSEDNVNQFEKGVTYGISIDTTAQTAQGVSFGYRENVTFVPNP